MVWLRRALPFLGVLILLGLIYDGFIFYSRANRNREEKQALADRAAEQERKTAAAYGGLGLKILTFYAAHVPDRPTSLCYGVTGAKTVRMEPPVDGVWPALTRCVQVSPKKDTEYKLIAEDKAGHAVTQSVAVHVRP
jgi:hypothetical protein